MNYIRCLFNQFKFSILWKDLTLMMFDLCRQLRVEKQSELLLNVPIYFVLELKQ